MTHRQTIVERPAGPPAGGREDRVDLEHRNIGRPGDGAASIVDGVSDGSYGHPFYLRRFAAAAEDRRQR